MGLDDIRSWLEGTAMPAKDALLTEIEDCWRTVRREVEGLDPATPVYPDPAWNLRDVLVHCAFWNDETVKSLEAFRNGDQYQTDTGAGGFDAGLDALNQRTVEAARSMSDDEAHAHWVAAQDRLTEAVRDVPDAQLGATVRTPWHKHTAVHDMIRSELGHETEHITDIVSAASAQEDA